MKRRLTIARALVNDPELLLLDEPTTGLDPQARHLLWERLYRLKREGVTQIITTHYMDEAEQLCDRLVVMDGGADRGRGLAGRADRAVLHPGGAGAALRARAAPEPRMPLVAARRAGGGAARPAAALHRRRRARAGRGGRAGLRRCPRWSAAPRWRTCSSGSPAGRWWTDDRPAVPRARVRQRPRPWGACCASSSATGPGTGATGGPPSCLGAAAAAVPAGVRRRVRLAGGRHRPGRRGHRRRRLPGVAGARRCWRCRRCRAAAFESTYPVLSGFKWQRVYHAMTAGPVSPGPGRVGHLSWVAPRWPAPGRSTSW